MKPQAILIFAAGHGTRMRELTENRPKPLIPVAGKPLLDHALELADEAGIPRQIVNTHYLGHMIEAHVSKRTDVSVSAEADEALETGGGLKFALPKLRGNPVLTLNSDAVWTGRNPLLELTQNWDLQKMEALLALVPLDRATGHNGNGDFSVGADGRLRRFTGNEGKAFVYTGAQMLRTERVEDYPGDRFSFNPVWDQMIDSGTLFGCIHEGGWADVGSPEGIKAAEAMLNV